MQIANIMQAFCEYFLKNGNCQQTIMTKKEMLDALILHYDSGNKAQFARRLGIKPQTINTWESRGSLDIELIFAKCVDISGDWLLSGEGEMLRSKRYANLTLESDKKLIQLCRQLVFFYEQKENTLAEITTMMKGVD